MSGFLRFALLSRVCDLKKLTGLIHVGTMAVNSGRLSLTCRRCLSGSAVDGPARVKRVSIEGNIGKYRLFRDKRHDEYLESVVYFPVSVNIVSSC